MRNGIFQFLKETDHDWAYWSIDGYKYPDEPEGNYKFIIDNQIELLKFTDRVNQIDNCLLLLVDNIITYNMKIPGFRISSIEQYF